METGLYDLKIDAIRFRMQAKGLTKAGLARKLNMDVSTIKRWLRGGKVRLSNMKPLAEALDLSVHEIAFGFEEERKRIEVTVTVVAPEEFFDDPYTRDNFLALLERFLNTAETIKLLGKEKGSAHG